MHAENSGCPIFCTAKTAICSKNKENQKNTSLHKNCKQEPKDLESYNRPVLVLSHELLQVGGIAGCKTKGFPDDQVTNNITVLKPFYQSRCCFYRCCHRHFCQCSRILLCTFQHGHKLKMIYILWVLVPVQHVFIAWILPTPCTPATNLKWLLKQKVRVEDGLKIGVKTQIFCGT